MNGFANVCLLSLAMGLMLVAGVSPAFAQSVRWTRTLDHPGELGTFNSVAVAPDGGILTLQLLVRPQGNLTAFEKLDENGNTEWARIDTATWSHVVRVAERLVVCGVSEDSLALAVIGDDGTMQPIERLVAGAQPTSAVATNDGAVAIICRWSLGSFLLVKVTPDGRVLWQRPIHVRPTICGGSEPAPPIPSLCPFGSGGVAVLRQIVDDTPGGTVTAFSDAGDSLWSKDAPPDMATALHVRATDTGTLIVSGFSGSRSLVYEMSQTGDSLGLREWELGPTGVEENHVLGATAQGPVFAGVGYYVETAPTWRYALSVGTVASGVIWRLDLSTTPAPVQIVDILRYADGYLVARGSMYSGQSPTLLLMRIAGPTAAAPVHARVERVDLF